MPLILGPILRHVSDTTAVVWVQTESAAEVQVLGSSTHTFEVQGHHYALVIVRGLRPDSVTEYQVLVDGEPAWPEPDSPFPPSVIRTRGPDTADRARVVFGSCRYPKTCNDRLDAKLGTDALDSYASRLTALPAEEWPDALLLLGDQVYADELTPDTRRHLAGHRLERGQRPPDEVVTFDEYARLYTHTWSDPEIRWVLSTLPTAMIFDDHDIRDDWNTSATWRDAINKKPWWRDRIRAGLASYWVYQHLGNLAPDELGADPDYQAVLADGGDCWPHLVELADRADREAEGRQAMRFSFRWDLGRTRLVVIDSRNARVLHGERKMVDDSEFDWVEAQLCDDLESLDHLLVATSLPWLLPPAVSDLQSVNELAAGRADVRGRLAERIRQAADLEHWAAFGQSFLRLSAALAHSAGHPASGPATVSVLSGDVHHSYAARAEFGGSSGVPVHQLVCSPVHNIVPAYLKPVLKLAWSPRVARISRRWALRRGAPELPMSWRNCSGPVFGNTIATLSAAGRSAEAVFEQPDEDGELAVAAEVRLSD